MNDLINQDLNNNILKIKGNDEGDDFIVTSTLNINNTKISSTLSYNGFYNLINKSVLELLKYKENLTRDLGGKASTTKTTDNLINILNHLIKKHV